MVDLSRIIYEVHVTIHLADSAHYVISYTDIELSASIDDHLWRMLIIIPFLDSLSSKSLSQVCQV